MFAPITGAWIETYRVPVLALKLVSHPSRVRGLKRIQMMVIRLNSSHPSRVRGLKL